jgi:hypothetical protein
MKVKVNDMVYDANEVPIMLILNPLDKVNIMNMQTTADRYACFPGDCDWSKEEKEAWMDEGYEQPT